MISFWPSHAINAASQNRQKPMTQNDTEEELVLKQFESNLFRHFKKAKLSSRNLLNIQINQRYINFNIKNYKAQTMKFLMLASSSEPTTKTSRQGCLKQLTPEETDALDNHFILSHPNIRVFCDCCRKNITLSTFILTEGHQFCVGCFSKFQDFPDSYSVYERISYCLTDENWITLDEILLLNGFQKWGFGNWGEIKDYMGYNGANFSKDQLRNHYDKYFLANEQMMPIFPSDLVFRSRQDRTSIAHRKIEYLDKINEKNKPQQFKSEQALPKFDAASLPKKKQANILGYNPKRKCFMYDYQYDDKAESLLSDLQFRDDDTPEQTELKFQIIENFNIRQTERLKRYEFTLDHHILDIDYRYKQEISASKYEKEAFLKFKKFTRFQSYEENQKTRALIAQSSFIKSMIQGLKKCRRKIDEEGRISQTLGHLRNQLGAPRKIYRIDIPEEKIGNQLYLLESLERQLKSDKKKDEPTKLSIIYRSPDFNLN